MRKKSILKILLTVFAILTVVIALIIGAVFCGRHLYYDSDNYHSKMLVEAIREENIDAVQQIVEKKPTCINEYPSIMPMWWFTLVESPIYHPFNEACATGNIELIELLIKNGADVNCNDGLTPLSIVYQYKCDDWYEISQILIENGASLDYTTEYSGGKASVFQDICFDGYIPKPTYDEEVLKAFNYALENVNHNNVNWMQVLQHSVSNDRIEIVKLLLEQKYCTVNDTSVGMTALMFAARDSDEEMVQLLLDYGADKTITDEDGKTAYDYAVEYERDAAIVELLRP